MPNVVLIGYRGSGKTTVGRLLADRLKCGFVDTDDEVVRRSGKSIAAIFAEHGEEVFREWEAAVIAEACARSPIVLSVGGGAVLRDDNVGRLRAGGAVVWLYADAETLWARIKRDVASPLNRPALTEWSGLEEVRRVLAEREPLYRMAAHHQVDASGDDPAAVAQYVAACIGS